MPLICNSDFQRKVIHWSEVWRCTGAVINWRLSAQHRNNDCEWSEKLKTGCTSVKQEEVGCSPWSVSGFWQKDGLIMCQIICKYARLLPMKSNTIDLTFVQSVWDGSPNLKKSLICHEPRRKWSMHAHFSAKWIFSHGNEKQRGYVEKWCLWRSHISVINFINTLHIITDSPTYIYKWILLCEEINGTCILRHTEHTFC